VAADYPYCGGTAGPKEKSVNVTATNFNVPGLPHNLSYLKQTDEALEGIGYVLADNTDRSAIQVLVTAKVHAGGQ
jgi:hypothetical protein